MEKVLIMLENIELSFFDRVVLEIPRLAIHQFDRIGIVGKNGAGKSTLLKLLSGQINPDKGRVNHFTDCAYFDQLSSSAEPDIDYKLAGKLSIPKTDLKNFSGGEQTRLKLAGIFTNYHEVLLIDEPTTHLDFTGIQFFIDAMRSFHGAFLLVSHNRNVLDQLVTKIWEIDEGHINEYTGNYSDYAAKKELERKQQEQGHEEYIKEKNRLINSAEEKLKKAEKITQANGHISKKETKAKANKMFMSKSKETSQKSV